MLPRTTHRVPSNTADAINRRISRQTARSVAYHADRPEGIDDRLDALEREWDIERVLEANAATLALAGIALGTTTDRRFLVLPALVTAFLLQHALEGWCPPLPLLRRLGFRTATEIEQERYALKMLRGDFATAPEGGADDRAARILKAVRA